jgi:hypothetical protein
LAQKSGSWEVIHDSVCHGLRSKLLQIRHTCDAEIGTPPGRPSRRRPPRSASSSTCEKWHGSEPVPARERVKKFRTTSRYQDVMPKQTTVRLPDDLADDAEAVARTRGSSVNQLIIDSLAAEIERVRADEDFTARAKKLLERDREILDRLAK